jgi:hypothetical protein
MADFTAPQSRHSLKSTVPPFQTSQFDARQAGQRLAGMVRPMAVTLKKSVPSSQAEWLTASPR